jgi:polyhydroxyalkanoate synthesis regulator protein
MFDVNGVSRHPSIRLYGEAQSMFASFANPQAPVEHILVAAEETNHAQDMYDQIQASQDKLFFIQYAAEQMSHPN